MNSVSRLLRSCLFFCLLAWLVTAGAATPSVALYYAADAPLEELKAFDIVVVEADHGFDPKRYRKPYSELYAYVAVGEVQASRSYASLIPQERLLTVNADWGSKVVDLTWQEWPQFVAEVIVAPLWEKGYRGFFLDTLDSYRLASKFDEAAQQQGLIAVVENLHRRFPGIRLILNRGFEVIPSVKDKVQMVAAESLFRGWNAGTRRYTEVSEADRAWLLGELRKVRDEHGIPVLAIDYVPPQNRTLMRQTAEKIRAQGIEPWVTDSALATLGIGRREVVPRKILMLYDGRQEIGIIDNSIARFPAMPINHLGYATEFHDINRPLPTGSLAARYAGIVLWAGGNIPRSRALSDWLRQQIDSGLRVAVFGSFGFTIDAALGRKLGLSGSGDTQAAGKLKISAKDPMMGFEAAPQPDRRALLPLRLAPGQGQTLLQLTDEKGRIYDAAALTAWGGYVLEPFAVVAIPGSEQSRWIIDPFAFLQRALALPELPLPDTTTENGRRLMFIHIDGDGYPSRAEKPGTPLAGRALLTDVIERYKLPTTMSVIEGEVAPHGLYPELSAEMEEIARKTFALPYVEIASHSCSHPFAWYRAEGIPSRQKEPESYHLEIPGYTLDLEREIIGSVAYIRNRLAPPGKPVNIMLWSGDAAPQEKALRMSEDAGLLNMNGGNTIITKAFPSLTAVSPLGVTLGGVFQTLAPVMNENLYTNLWQGPYYGFERVIETFQMTDKPRRLKPINIYFHTYSASKKASLNALYKVYDWALAQSPHIIYGSDFIRKARDFNSLVLARENGAWLIRGNGDLRTVRTPTALGYPAPEQSTAVAGYVAGSEGLYIHLAGDNALLRFSGSQPKGLYLNDANARLTEWQQNGTLTRFTLKGHQPIEFSLARASTCTLSSNGKALLPRRTVDAIQFFRLNNAAATIEARCRDR